MLVDMVTKHRCVPDKEHEALLLYYKSMRDAALIPLVVGMVREIAKVYFGITIDMELLTTQNEDSEFTTWRIRETGVVHPEMGEAQQSHVSNFLAESVTTTDGICSSRPTVPDSDSHNDSAEATVDTPTESPCWHSTSNTSLPPVISDTSSSLLHEPDGSPYPVLPPQLPATSTATPSMSLRCLFASPLASNYHPAKTKSTSERECPLKKVLSGQETSMSSQGNCPVRQSRVPKNGPPQQSTTRHHSRLSKVYNLSTAEAGPPANYGLSGHQLQQAFPFHVVFRQDLTILQHGNSLVEFAGQSLLGTKMNDVFDIFTPVDIDWVEWERLVANCSGERIELTLKLNQRGSSEHLTLAGQLLFSVCKEVATFLAVPSASSLQAMTSQGVTFSHLESHDSNVKLVLAREHLQSQTQEGCRFMLMRNQLEEEKNKRMVLMKTAAENAEKALATKRNFVRYVR